jgi:hypothetical protein
VSSRHRPLGCEHRHGHEYDQGYDVCRPACAGVPYSLIGCEAHQHEHEHAPARAFVHLHLHHRPLGYGVIHHDHTQVPPASRCASATAAHIANDEALTMYPRPARGVVKVLALRDPVEAGDGGRRPRCTAWLYGCGVPGDGIGEEGRHEGDDGEGSSEGERGVRVHAGRAGPGLVG